MRIGIDARELCGHPTGVGRYLSGLLRQWSRAGSAEDHQFVLYAHEPLPIDTTRPAALFTSRVIPGSGGTWWEQVPLRRAIRNDRPDVFFAPGYTAPLRLPVPLVVAIHDVSFAAHPEWFNAREGWRRRFLSRRAAAAAAVVITISEFSRREIVAHLGGNDRRIAVIPPGIDVISGAGPADNRSPRLLYVGSIFNRRHIPELLQAFAIIARAHPEAALDLVGDNRTHPRQDLEAAIDSHGLTGQVHWRKYVSDEELGRLYRQARAFAFLSEYEGLGLTPLEALSAGIPAVLLDTPVARESCDGAALYVRADDVPGIADSLQQLLFDPPVRARLLAAAPGVLGRYNWTDAGQRTLAVLESAATGGQSRARRP